MNWKSWLGVAVATATLSSCALYTEPADIGVDHSTMDMSGEASGDPMAGHQHNKPSGDGLEPSLNGFSLKDAEVNSDGTESDVSFRIVNSLGAPVVRFEREKGKLLHLLVFNNDLSRFTHAHPSVNPSGLWSTTVPDLGPGAQHLVMQFTVLDRDGTQTPLILGTDVEQEGAAPNKAIGPDNTTFEVDGLTVSTTGKLAANEAGTLTTTITKGGKPVTLTPYLESWLHITAINASTKAVTHVHPELDASEGQPSPKKISYEATLPEAGTYLIVVEFATEGGSVHTARFVKTI